MGEAVETCCRMTLTNLLILSWGTSECSAGREPDSDAGRCVEQDPLTQWEGVVRRFGPNPHATPLVME
jgi:hypothetical protein